MKPIKGIIFAGCSFTWGQGLYYYSDLPTIIEPPPNKYIDSQVTSAQKEVIKIFRYPRLVANHYNTFELVYHHNGGTVSQAIKWWRACLSLGSSQDRIDGDNIPKYDPSEISHLTFQLTQWSRDPIKFTHEGREYTTSYSNFMHDQYKDIFPIWLKNNNLTLDQFVDDAIKGVLKRLKDFLQDVESVGIKTTVFTWPTEYVDYIKQDPWLAKRFMHFIHEDYHFQSIEELMRENDNLEIKYDYEHFDTPPQDHHPSLECHRVIADNLIRFLDNEKESTDSR